MGEAILTLRGGGGGGKFLHLCTGAINLYNHSWKCNFLLPWDECCLLTTNINTIIISWRCAQLILDSTSALISFSLVFGVIDVNSLVIVLASK